MKYIGLKSLTHEQERNIREGMHKITSCYESTYREYVNTVTNGVFAHEIFQNRCRTIKRMRTNLEKLITHYVNSCQDSYEPIDDMDKNLRDLKINNYMCDLTERMSMIASHWNWLVDNPIAVNHLMRMCEVRKVRIACNI